MTTAPATTTEQTASEQIKTKTPRRGRRVLIASITAAVLVAAAGITVPLVIQNIEHQNAVTAYQDALRDLDAAQKTLTANLAAQSDAQAAAVTEYQTGSAILAAAQGENFDPMDAVAALAAELESYLGAAGLAQDDAGDGSGAISAVPTAVGDVTLPKALTADNTADELIKGAKALTTLTGTVKTDAKAVADATALIDPATVKLHAAEDALVQAALASATSWPRPEKSSDDSWAAYTGAVEALKTASSTDPTAIAGALTGYIAGRTGAQASHDETVAAERAAAEAAAAEAARQAAAQQQQNTRRGGTTGGSNTGGNRTGGSNTGGSNSGGGLPGGEIFIPKQPGGTGTCPETMICWG